MTVRWKPLLVLSGLFLVIAVAGLVAIVFALVPRDSAEILRLARAERAAKQFEQAEIQYQRALQQDPHDAPDPRGDGGHVRRVGRAGAGPEAGRAEGPAAAVAGGGRQVPARRPWRRGASCSPRPCGTTTPPTRCTGPRNCSALDPADADVDYVLAEEALEPARRTSPRPRAYLAHLDREKPRRPRAEWIRARLAQQTGDRGPAGRDPHRGPDAGPAAAGRRRRPHGAAAAPRAGRRDDGRPGRRWRPASPRSATTPGP